MLVVFNHSRGYQLYMFSSGSKQIFYMILTMLTRINTPIFFMISGALLLGKNEDYKTVLQKRVKRFVIVIFIFSTLYHLTYLAVTRSLNSFSIKQWLVNVFNGDILFSYWYLYAYLGLLIMLPFLQKIAQKMNTQEFAVLLILRFFIFSFIPIINILFHKLEIGTLTIKSNFSVPLISVNAFFFSLIGYYLENNVNVSVLKKKQCYAMAVLMFLGITLSCLCTYHEGWTTGQYTENYVQLFDYISTICVFLLVKVFVTRTQDQIGPAVKAAVCMAGSLTFGIYLLEPCLKIIFYYKFENWAEPLFPTLFVSLSWCIISMIMGGLITLGLKQLPLIKKLI